MNRWQDRAINRTCRKIVTPEAHSTRCQHERRRKHLPHLSLTKGHRLALGRVVQGPSPLPSDITPDPTITDTHFRLRVEMGPQEWPSLLSLLHVTHVTNSSMGILRLNTHSSASCQIRHSPSETAHSRPLRRIVDV